MKSKHIIEEHAEGLKLSKLSNSELRAYSISAKHTIEERAVALSFIVWAAIIIFTVVVWLFIG